MLLLFLVLSLNNVLLAEQVIEPAPLSIEDDGTRKLKVNPEVKDGELKLTENKLEVKNADSISKTPDIKEENIQVIHVFFVRKRYIQFSISLLNSHYDKIDSSLDNGSTLSSLRFLGDYSQTYQVGLGVEVISDNSKQKIPENIRALNYRLFVDRHVPVSFFHDKIEGLYGLAFSMGDYGIKKRYINGLGQEVSQKIKEGLLFGLIPSAGIRIYLGQTGSLDVLAEYHLYFGKPQTYIGGMALSPRFNLEF